MFIPHKKYLYFIFIFLYFTSFLRGQQLITTNLKLDNNGAVYDVAIDSARNEFIIVGKFDSINNIAHKNIAFIDATTYVLKSTNPISSIDGSIKTIAVKGLRIFIGGDFTTINGAPHLGLALIQRAILTFTPTLHSWAPLNNGAEMGDEHINALEIYGDTLFVAGKFSTLTASSSYNTKNGLATVNITPLTDNTCGEYSTVNNMGEVFDVKKHGSSIYLAATDFDVTDDNLYYPNSFQQALCKLNNDGTFDPLFNPSWFTSGDNPKVLNLSTSEFGIYAITTTHLGNELHRFDYSTGTLLNVNVISGANSPPFYEPNDLFYYKKKIYFTRKIVYPSGTTLNFGGRNILKAYPFWDGILANPVNNGSVNRVRNLLWVSEDDMLSVSGSSRKGLAIYCLEPYNASYFSVLDTTVCPNQQNVIFTVPPVPYATKYHWYYTGSGADIAATGNGNVILSGTSYNSVSIDFSLATDGQLCIVPMSSCNERADTLKINIHTLPLPNSNAGIDSSLTCKYPEIDIIGTSLTSNVSYTWNGPMGFAVINDTATINTVGNYILSVTEPINNCVAYDTLIIDYDTAKPSVFLPPPPYQLTCNILTLTLDGYSNESQTILKWRNNSDGYLYPDPYTITQSGNYALIVTDTLNGCSDSAMLLVTHYEPLPNIALQGYPIFSPVIPIDTLTCYQPVVTMLTYSDTNNTVIYFSDSSFTSNYGDSLQLDSGGIYYIYAKDTVNGCSNTSAFVINEFFNLPDIAILSTSGEFNCSIDSIVLLGTSLLSDTNFNWSGPSIVSGTNPILVTDTGYYYVTNTRSDNGCSITDSIHLLHNPNLNIVILGDSIVCKNNAATLFANAPGITESVSYLWNTLENYDTIHPIVTGNQFYSVQGSTLSGCLGYDTILVQIPPEPTDSIVAFKPCNSDSSGQLIVYLQNGLAPYQYSLNGINYQSINQFTNLPIGSYTIYINDSMNCNYQYSAEITENSAVAIPLFLNATYNYLHDTVALVDISSPVPDSTYWEIPNEFTPYFNGNPALIIANDTGTFQIGLTGYYGGCSSTFSKTIIIRVNDSSYADFTNTNGIKKFILYPNPNTGNFTIELEFYKKQDFYLSISDNLGFNYYTKTGQSVYGENINITMPSTTTNGTYLVRVISEFDSKTLHFILNR